MELNLHLAVHPVSQIQILEPLQVLISGQQAVVAEQAEQVSDRH